MSSHGKWNGILLVSRTSGIKQERNADTLDDRFEAFDESWKIIYDTPGKNWEDKWGLMDAGRNLKAGLTIPDCGGKTVS